ncbi:MAG TPA: hypothetical protein VL588_07130 [Bdellovibrionota bacterium]|jgi:hypothetical protein|nr:hypothetical protein [Bdellovibrionota bacterium]
MTLKKSHRFVSILALVLMLESGMAGAVELEKKGAALAAVLGTTKVFQYKTGIPAGADPKGEMVPAEYGVFYDKDASGKATKIAVAQTWIWEKQCRHGWVVGLDAKTSKVQTVHFTEMQCPHAEPVKGSFNDQFVGKGPADVQTLVEKVDTVAKATGSAILAAKAVKVAIQQASALQGKI